MRTAKLPSNIQANHDQANHKSSIMKQKEINKYKQSVVSYDTVRSFSGESVRYQLWINKSQKTHTSLLTPPYPYPGHPDACSTQDPTSCPSQLTENGNWCGVKQGTVGITLFSCEVTSLEYLALHTRLVRYTLPLAELGMQCTNAQQSNQ